MAMNTQRSRGSLQFRNCAVERQMPQQLSFLPLDWFSGHGRGTATKIILVKDTMLDAGSSQFDAECDKLGCARYCGQYEIGLIDTNKIAA